VTPAARPSSQPPRRALVIGAGPAGLATAIALRSRGMEAHVFEQSGRLDGAGTGLTLWPNALRALATFGADEPIREAGLAAEGNEIRTADGRLLDVVSGDQMRARFGGTGIALHRAELVEALVELATTDVVHLGARCVGYSLEGPRVAARFADGSEVAGDLLVGADGINSRVRAQVVARDDLLRYGGYAVWRGVAKLSLGRAPGMLAMGAGAQFGAFPMRDGRAYWFASLTMREGVGRTLPARALLRERFDGWLDPVCDLLDATADEQIVVSDIYDSRPLRRWGRGAVTLVGDAAHPSAPTLGQGTCQAFEDAAALAHRLATPGPIEPALRAYESCRRRRANGMTRQARRLGQVGKWRRPASVWLREQLIGRSPSGPRMRQMERMFAFDVDARA